MTIKTKIIIPYVVLFLGVFLLTMIISLQITSNAVEERIIEQLKNLSGMLSQGGFTMSPALTEEIKSLTGAEAVHVYSSHGALSAEPDTDVLPIFRDYAKKPFTFYKTTLNNRNILFVSIPLSKDGAMVLIFSADSIYSRKASATKPILLIGIASLILILVFGFIIAHTITKPVYELVRKTSEIARGQLDVPVQAKTGDELAVLAESFNTMQKGLKKYEQEMLRTEKLATLGKFSANIAHEIRNPLTSMQMLMQMTESGETDPTKKETAKIVLKEIQRLSIFVEQILDIANPRKLNLQETDLNAAVTETVAIVEQQGKHLSIKITVSLQERLSRIKADPDGVKQVLMNLILNAFSAIGEKGEVTVETRAEQNGFALLSVYDTGSGIPEEIKANLFQPFFSTKQTGTGLGLALCRRIISEHNGQIEFDALNGKTVFRVRIPFA